MLYCKKCNVNIRGNKQYCPLCHGELTGTPEDPAFPILPEKKMTRFNLWKLALFLFIAYEVILGAVLYLFQISWIPMAMLIGIFAIIDVLLILYYRRSTIKLVTYETYMIMLLAIIVSSYAGYSGFVYAWFIPLGFISLIPATIFINKINHLYLEDYMIYLIGDVLFSFIQIFFIYKNWNPHPILAVASIAFMIVFAAALFIFRNKELRNASSKYLHM